MGHAVALIHDNYQIELWLLSPEPLDTEFRADTELWVKHLMEYAVKDTFAHMHIKNYHHVRYCWINPVKHGLVGHPREWAFSSWHRDAGGPVW